MWESKWSVAVPYSVPRRPQCEPPPLTYQCLQGPLASAVEGGLRAGYALLAHKLPLTAFSLPLSAVPLHNSAVVTGSVKPTRVVANLSRVV